MDKTKNMAALFDFDGVVMDTETQYSRFWNRVGEEYLHRREFANEIKGQTLVQIFRRYFDGMEHEQSVIAEELDRFEAEMSYEYIAGVREFMRSLREGGVKIAIVTSSDEKKMAHVHAAHPEFRGMVDCILTAERFAHSKPAPDCFLLGMEVFGSVPETTFVFEDSFHGLEAGRASGAKVIGLATTNPREAIAGKADVVIDDFTGMTCDVLLSMK